MPLELQIKNHRTRLLYLVLALLTTSVCSANDEGWIALFDGDTLGGWEEIGSKNAFRVEDGFIIGRSEPGGGTAFLCPIREFTDFEVEYEVKLIDAGLNSGVHVHSVRKGADTGRPGPLVGPQGEVNGKNWRNYGPASFSDRDTARGLLQMN